MDDIGYSGPLYNNKTHAIKVRTGDDILNAAKDAVCGELMVAKGGQFPGLYIATKTSGDDVELCRISEITPENKLPIDHNYSLKFLEGDHLDLNSTMAATGEFTLSFWIKPLEDPGSVNPWVIYGENNEYIAWYGPNSGNKLLVGGMGSITSSTNSLIVDNWYHVFLVRNSNDTIELFINGSSEGTSVFSGSIGFNKIGWTSYNLRGLWDEFAFWDSDQSENFSAIYNNGNPADLSFYSPTHWWRMGDAENGNGSTIADQGSGGNNLTINGATFSKDTPYNNSSLKFNGVDSYLDTGSTFSDTFNKDFSISLWFKGTTQIGQ
ncbi:MAG: LamG domain-containing protein, partial [Flavobacteriaceae bacterium]